LKTIENTGVLDGYGFLKIRRYPERERIGSIPISGTSIPRALKITLVDRLYWTSAPRFA
jgi:hypothetical protein